MAKDKKILMGTDNTPDDIDKFIIKLAKIKYKTPYHTKQKVKKTINYIFSNNK